MMASHPLGSGSRLQSLFVWPADARWTCIIERRRCRRTDPLSLCSVARPNRSPCVYPQRVFRNTVAFGTRTELLLGVFYKRDNGSRRSSGARKNAYLFYRSPETSFGRLPKRIAIVQ